MDNTQTHIVLTQHDLQTIIANASIANFARTWFDKHGYKIMTVNGAELMLSSLAITLLANNEAFMVDKNGILVP